MDAKINYVLLDANALHGTIDNNRTAMDVAGYSAESYASFTSAIIDLKTKETAQQKAMETVGIKTALLNAEVEKSRDLIRDVRFAAKSAYGKDELNLKLFKIGDNIPESVASLISLLNALNILIAERQELLMKNGLIQRKINGLAAAPVELESIDRQQENAKSAQKSRTLERNAAAKVLKEEMAKVRNFANSCFSDKPEILLQFDPIPKGRGGSGNDDEPTPPESPTPQAGS